MGIGHVPQCVLYLPGTGDHGFTLRRNLAHGLLKRGVAAVILEGPFYGRRRPPLQPGAKLRHVTDLLLLGRTTIEVRAAFCPYNGVPFYDSSRETLARK